MMNGKLNKQYGWLTWWTINTAKIHDVTKITAMARAQSDFPSKITDGIRGEDADRAWFRSTRLPASGLPATGMTAGKKGRYITRDLEDGTRMIALETLDESDRTISSERVALLWRADVGKGRGHSIESGERASEVEGVISSMYSDLMRREGNMDGGKVRMLLLDWLKSVNRVGLRGDAGGVYFLPIEGNVDDQLLAIREWLAATGVGSMTVVEMWEGKATTISEVQDSALGELQDEVDEINKSLSEYADNALQNNGSRMFCAGKMAERADALQEKAQALAVVLEEKMGVVDEMIRLVKGRAVKMGMAASAAVQSAKPIPEAKPPKAEKPSSSLPAQRKSASQKVGDLLADVTAGVIQMAQAEVAGVTLAGVQALHDENQAAVAAAAPKRRGRPPGSKGKPKVEMAKKVGTQKTRSTKTKL